MGRPKKTQIEKAQEDFDKFDEQVKELTLDRMNQAPKKEEEPLTKLSQKEIEKSKDIYLKPERQIGDGQKFNPRFKEKWEHAKEFVQFIAENREIQGEAIEIWTHPFGGVPAQFWRVPVKKPVWGPRHLAEQLRRCQYHTLVMDQTKIVESGGMGTVYGAMAVENIVNRLDAQPINTSKNIFMGASSF